MLKKNNLKYETSKKINNNYSVISGAKEKKERTRKLVIGRVTITERQAYSSDTKPLTFPRGNKYNI